MTEIRPARPDDAPGVQDLLAQLGYALSVQAVEKRLTVLAARGSDPVLLALRDDRPVGLVAVHWTIMLHLSAPSARITALVVDHRGRGHGIGRALIDAAADLARTAGCEILELTTGLQRLDAQAFYKAVGFTASSLKLQRSLI